MNKLKRYLLFLAGLFVNALGVSLVTKASLGTSPISSIPYVLSLNYPLTLGNFTIIFSIFLILLQLLILRKNFKIENVLQIPVSIAFGYFIDLTMYMFFWVDPQNYVVKLISLLAGCVVLGFGVYMEVLADVVMLPGESFVRAIVQTWNTNFGTTKIIFDSSMTIMAGVLSVLFFGKLNGVREGTIMAALLVGFIARLFGKYLEFVKPYIFSEDYKTVEAQDAGNEKIQYKNIIVIGRQYGSGGHDIGKVLADKLGYDFYDQDIIKMAAKTTGMTSEFIGKREETMTNSLLYDLVNQMYQYKDEREQAPKDKIFAAESKVIRELADKGNCVIIGRCSDYILRDNKRVLKVFFNAPLESRIKRVMKRQGVEYSEAQHRIRKTDKYRADNYRYYTGRIWGASSNFDLTINTDFGIDFIEKYIKEALNSQQDLSPV
ncbi:predicted membrane protein [Clostridium sp. CAG:167]|nr:predicted membrane protein [Clostridium sp. CAG:167]